MNADALKQRLDDAEERRIVLEAWKAIVGVQMHFNDMLMRVRNLGVTLMLAVFGAAAFSLQYELFFVSPCGRFHRSCPDSCGKEKWRILPVEKLTTNRPPGRAATGGTRHGQGYQEVGASAAD